VLAIEVLEDLGYTATKAADSDGGLNVLSSVVRIDVLADVGLPGGINGRHLADAARESRPNLNVLFITGFAESALLNYGQLDPGISVLTSGLRVNTFGRGFAS